MNNTPVEMHGARRAAILLLALDEDSAANVFKYFSDTEVKRISLEMATLAQLPQDDIRQVLEEFSQEYEEFAAINLHSSDHIRAVLTKALGSERADRLIESQSDIDQNSTGLDSLNQTAPLVVADMIRDEHPQIIATILLHLERQQASDVLELFDDALRNEVVLRIATFTEVQPEALQELTDVLGGMLDGQHLKRSRIGGVRTAAEILNLMNTAQEAAMLETLRAHNEELAQQIIDEMFLFENLLDLDDRSIQLLLREIDTDSLVVALKGAPEAIMELFIRNMSLRAAQLLREDMEARGPLRLSQVEGEQKAILQVVRRLVDSGEMVLNGGDETYV